MEFFLFPENTVEQDSPEKSSDEHYLHPSLLATGAQPVGGFLISVSVHISCTFSESRRSISVRTYVNVEKTKTNNFSVLSYDNGNINKPFLATNLCLLIQLLTINNVLFLFAGAFFAAASVYRRFCVGT